MRNPLAAWAWSATCLTACGAAPAPSPPPPASGAELSAQPSASPETPLPRLAVGEAIELRVADGRVTVSLPPAADEEYVLVLTSTELARTASFGYRAQALAVRAVSSEHRAMTGCSFEPLTPRPVRTEPPKASSTPALGSRRDWTLRTTADTRPITAEVRAVGAHTVVWADVTKDRPAELDPSFVDAFLKDFEATVLPRARAIFGTESDIDGDGRIALLFTPQTRDAAVAYFSGCDLRAECSGSNQAEVLYLTPPNAIEPPYNTPRAMKEILAHELEHLLHHQQKVLGTALREDPDSLYLLEGFGALAQDVTGLQAGNLYVTMAALQHVDQVSLVDVLQPGRGYDPERDGALRGAAYLLVRWLYDRAGADEIGPDGGVIDRGGPSLVRELLGAPRSIVDQLQRETDLGQLAVELYTSWAMPAGTSANPCLTYRKPTRDPVTGRQRGADPFASFHGMSMTGAAAQTLDNADGELRGGGVELLALRSDADGPVTARLQVDTAARPRVVLVRRR